MDSNNLKDEFLIKKLAYPYEYFNLDNFQEPLNLTKDDFWSTLKQETPPDEEINRTPEIVRKFNLKTAIVFTMFYLQMDVLQLADVFENFVQTPTEEYGINPLYSYSAPEYTWKAGLKVTKINIDFMKDKELLLLLENNFRGGSSSVIGDRNVESDENTKLLYIDANTLYEWAMSQPLPSNVFEKLDISQFTTQEIIEDLIMIPDDNESGFFIECDLEYRVEIKEKTKKSIVPLSNKSRCRVVYTSYE